VLNSTVISTGTQASATNPAEISADLNNHPRRFDQETYNQLTALDGRLLEAIHYDCRIMRAHSPQRASYSVKPQAYFAKILGVTRETVSDHYRKLEKLGILAITHRRKIHGLWQTNLTRIVSWIWWRLGKVLRKLRGTPHRVTQLSHIATPKRVNDNREPLKGGPVDLFTQQILARWEQRGLLKPKCVP